MNANLATTSQNEIKEIHVVVFSSNQDSDDVTEAFAGELDEKLNKEYPGANVRVELNLAISGDYSVKVTLINGTKSKSVTNEVQEFVGRVYEDCDFLTL